ncbi:MAG: cytochrome c [Gammaproteobacteria bacterium]
MKRVLILILTMCTLSTTALRAEPTGEDQIAYRKAVMSAIGAHAGALAAMVRGKVDYDHMASQASAMADTVSTIGDIFPAASSSEAGETEALAAIWEDTDGFAEAVAASIAAASSFSETAAAGDRAAVGKAFGALAGTCKGCHDNYRQAH